MSKPIPWGVPTPPDGPSDPSYRLRLGYRGLRASCDEMEGVLGAIEPGAHGLSAKDLKRLDKAVTLIKVGIKLAKKALRERFASAGRPLRRVA